MASSTTIQITRETRDRLAQLAAERGLPIGRYVAQLAEAQPTEQEIAEKLAADREHIRTVIGLDLSDADFAAAPDVLANIKKLAADKARARRGTAA